MYQQETFQIDDKEFVIQELPYTKALLYFLKTSKLIKGISGGLDASLLANGNLKTFFNPGKLLEGILNSLEPEQFVLLIHSLLEDSLVKPSFTKNWFDIEFAGKSKNLFLILSKIIALNYTNNWEEILKQDFLSILLPKKT